MNPLLGKIIYFRYMLLSQIQYGLTQEGTAYGFWLMNQQIRVADTQRTSQWVNYVQKNPANLIYFHAKCWKKPTTVQLQDLVSAYCFVFSAYFQHFQCIFACIFQVFSVHIYPGRSYQWVAYFRSQMYRGSSSFVWQLHL